MKRSNQLEYIDTGQYTLQEYRDCLYQLDKVGRFLGGDRATFQALAKISGPIKSLLDVGCGGGLFTLRLGKRFSHAHIEGIDLSAEAIAFAKEQPPLPNVSFYQSPTLPDKKYDVVLSTLVCHHLQEEELIAFIQKAAQIANKAVIINDLHRHSLAWIGFALLTPLCFPNRLVWHDGLLSIRRSFTKDDWVRILKQAGITSYAITWHWAFRWIVHIDANG